MKKVLRILLILIMSVVGIFLLTGCGEGKITNSLEEVNKELTVDYIMEKIFI